MAKKSSNNNFAQVVSNQKNVSLIFLGVGLCLFFLNIASFMSFIPIEYSEPAFDISIFSSMIIILYATYNLHKK